MEHRWRKSSRSGGDNGQCVELALPTDGLLVRDSKNVGGPSLRFAAGELARMADAVRAGRFTA